MSRIFITGSADGLGRAAAQTLLAQQHDVVLHVRHADRRHAVDALVDQGARVVVGDLSDRTQMDDVADQVARLAPVDVVIHNAGVFEGAAVLPVNVIAPYILTARLPAPRRLIYLSSNMHRSGTAALDGLDWTGRRPSASYSDSKLFVTALAFAVARRWPGVLCNAVDPGWVPTRMGGAGAPDDLRLGHLTQEWLATSDDPAAQVSGAYWHHQQQQEPHPAARNVAFQDALLATLTAVTGVALPAAGH